MTLLSRDVRRVRDGTGGASVDIPAQRGGERVVHVVCVADDVVRAGGTTRAEGAEPCTTAGAERADTSGPYTP
ncbi:hypothetical protein ACFQ69_00545 [Streptomyces sp. NPDC056470]|uniref:hypothetical protein n=1 Tax=Streptomyces sp. NPDC056470 TaxID=3345831 RepID=UPI003681F13C